MASADEAAASERWLSGSVRKDGARDLLSGMISGFFCKILEHGRVAKQGRYGRPSGVYQLAEAGRGWPRLEAPLSLICKILVSLSHVANRRPGSPEACLRASSRLRLTPALAGLGQSAAWVPRCSFGL